MRSHLPSPNRLNVRDSVRMAITFIAVLAVALIAWRLASLILLLFAAVLVAIFVHALAEWTARWTKLESGWSLLVVMTILAGSAVVAVF